MALLIDEERKQGTRSSDLTRQLPLREGRWNSREKGSCQGDGSTGAIVPARFQTAPIKCFWRRRGGDLEEETLPESDGRSRGDRTAAGGKRLLQPTPEQLQRGDSFSAGEPRVLGLAMVPGHHIVSVEVQRESLTCPPYL
ncbi:N-alpha-acetyltransferase 38, NatC auxiliary subunit isoform X2 [Monodelphis domestica]|uniref:N-alpha-acetyltransferase 38, NatC auxiliary subunit isoform X2 n=1 Tax=Monodelphis domestica TaxID=13616 RepID=UPI0007B4077D|nr:N-alpha-acetyltransferase 38, NatC auxiliary subunit isoform X2 [Monodelphis domestica]